MKFINMCEKYNPQGRLSGQYDSVLHKYRKQNPTLREVTRQSDINIIKEVQEKYKAHRYRWINHFIRNLYGIYYTDNYVHSICKYEDIKYQGKNYQ